VVAREEHPQGLGRAYRARVLVEAAEGRPCAREPAGSDAPLDFAQVAHGGKGDTDTLDTMPGFS
jgi:hypothetical protein